MNGIAEEFDKKALIYETYRLSAWYKAHSALILKQIRPKPNGLIIDIGCATGYLLRRLGHISPGTRGIGVDLSPNMIEEARLLAQKEGLSSITFTCRDFERCEVSEISNEPATVLVCANTLHYFKNCKKALSRMYELLDAGGECIILDRAMSGSILTKLWYLIHTRLLKDITSFYTKERLCQLLKEAGFSSVQETDQLKKLLWKGKIYTSIMVIKAVK